MDKIHVNVIPLAVQMSYHIIYTSNGRGVQYI